MIFAGDLADAEPPGPAPLPGLELRRVDGPLGTSFEAFMGDKRVGVFEVEDSYGMSNAQLARWADEGNHWVETEHRGQGIGSWLLRQGCEWLRHVPGD